jgi:hypothetical protein
MTAKDVQERAGLALLLDAKPLEGGSSYSFPHSQVDDPNRRCLSSCGGSFIALLTRLRRTLGPFPSSKHAALNPRLT